MAKLPMIVSCFTKYVAPLPNIFGKFPNYQCHWEVGHRCVHTTSKNQVPSAYEMSRKGDTKYDKEDKTSTIEYIKKGSKLFIPETKKLLHEVKEYFSQDNMAHCFPQDGVTDKYFSFNGPESLNDWIVSADSDFEEGYSTANLSITPTGTGLFSGNLCLRLPKTGNQSLAGYTNLKFVPPLRAFGRDHKYFFEAYTHLVLRVRGDGRSYMINLHPHNYFDVHWLDLYSYVLHTRGGPYWQETKVPFMKFFMHHKGRIQDRQFQIDLGELKTFSITCMDRNDGPFSLEVDYVGCSREEVFADEMNPFNYESYEVRNTTR